MTEAFAPASRTESATVLKTGTPSCVVPPLPGVTPPTTFVPYSIICFVWNVPSLPVMPCTTRRVFLSTRTLNVAAPQVARLFACLTAQYSMHAYQSQNRHFIPTPLARHIAPLLCASRNVGVCVRPSLRRLAAHRGW